MKYKPINWGNPVMKFYEDKIICKVYVFAGCIRLEWCRVHIPMNKNVYYAPNGFRFDSEEKLIEYMETGKKRGN